MHTFVPSLIVPVLLGTSLAFRMPIMAGRRSNTVRPRNAHRSCVCMSSSYLSSLSTVKLPPATYPTKPAAPTDINSVNGLHRDHEQRVTFSHAPFSYFAIDQLTPKGPRKNADVGQPHDATRVLTEIGSISSGSWWCAAGGWPSPAQRSTTEIFHVFSGHGCLTDTDGTKHYFGPGDSVILPKGWSGRWDVHEDLHKVWFVHDHPHVEVTSQPIRAIITHYNSLTPEHFAAAQVRSDATHGAPKTARRTVYDVGPTEVGYWTCTPGSFVMKNRPTTECFHILEGVAVLANADGSARRCVAGDTVVLPKGWEGHWDVIETVKKLWVVV